MVDELWNSKRLPVGTMTLTSWFQRANALNSTIHPPFYHHLGQPRCPWFRQQKCHIPAPHREYRGPACERRGSAAGVALAGRLGFMCKDSLGDGEGLENMALPSASQLVRGGAFRFSYSRITSPKSRSAIAS